LAIDPIHDLPLVRGEGFIRLHISQREGGANQRGGEEIAGVGRVLDQGAVVAGDLFHKLAQYVKVRDDLER